MRKIAATLLLLLLLAGGLWWLFARSRPDPRLAALCEQPVPPGTPTITVREAVQSTSVGMTAGDCPTEVTIAFCTGLPANLVCARSAGGGSHVVLVEEGAKEDHFLRDIWSRYFSSFPEWMSDCGVDRSAGYGIGLFGEFDFADFRWSGDAVSPCAHSDFARDVVALAEKAAAEGRCASWILPPLSEAALSHNLSRRRIPSLRILGPFRHLVSTSDFVDAESDAPWLRLLPFEVRVADGLFADIVRVNLEPPRWPTAVNAVPVPQTVVLLREGSPVADAFRALLRRREPWSLGHAEDDETRIAVHFSSDHGTSSQNLPARDLRDFAFELRSLLSAPPSATPSAGASVGASAGASDPIVAPND